MRIPKEIQDLQNAGGFDRQFFKLLAQPGMNQEKAFYQLYDQAVEYFGQCRYKNFDSYRISRIQRQRRK